MSFSNANENKKVIKLMADLKAKVDWYFLQKNHSLVWLKKNEPVKVLDEIAFI